MNAIYIRFVCQQCGKTELKIWGIGTMIPIGYILGIIVAGIRTYPRVARNLSLVRFVGLPIAAAWLASPFVFLWAWITSGPGNHLGPVIFVTSVVALACLLFSDRLEAKAREKLILENQDYIVEMANLYIAQRKKDNAPKGTSTNNSRKK